MTIVLRPFDPMSPSLHLSDIDHKLTTHIIATPQLIFELEEGRQQLELLSKESWMLGRHKTNHIHIRDSGVSRHHARIDILQGHHCLFSDLNSSNGSRINGQPITKPTLLKHGDRIKVGKVELLFQHSMLTIPGASIPPPLKQVLMLQVSAIQGKIWQEVLFSQNISAVWGAPGADLQQVIEANAIARTLPKLLLADISPYRATHTQFCQWCSTHYPQVSIVFIDRKPDQHPSTPAAANLPPHIHYLPAFPETQLAQQTAVFMEQTTAFLQIFEQRALRQSALISALTALEQLLQEVPAFATLLPPQPHSQPLPTAEDFEDDDQTDFFRGAQDS